MNKTTKRAKQIQAGLNDKKGASAYSPLDAINFLKNLPPCKFDQGLDLAVKLGIDARKGDQMVRGLASLPGGSGKKVRIAVFAEGDTAKEAKDAGADAVGMDDLAESMQKGRMDYDVVIATPATMKIASRLGRVLGPKGLMPNPKDGTVTNEVAATVKAAKSGQVRFRNEKGGIVHCGIGKLNANTEDLTKNFYAVLNEIRKLKPKTSKGVYLKRIFLSSTMGPSLEILPEDRS